MLRLFLFAILFLLPATSARADYFLWRDPDSGLTITFPDTWKRITGNAADDVLTIMAPSDGADPVCKVKIRDDRRYVIFPPSLGGAIQKTALSTPFWESYMEQEYIDYRLARVHDGAGLGRWFASYALASYSTQSGTAYQIRRGIMFASLYNDKVYILECSALDHAFDDWRYAFQSIVKSVDFKQAYHELPTGDYADFLKNADQMFWSQTSPAGTTLY